MFRRLSDSLYLYKDICNVYVLKHQDRALLIDFGAGAILDHLGDIGVNGVDWILHTHHHREQCQGDERANAHGIPIAVPAHERPYFDEVEVFWNSRQIYNIYDVRQSFNTLARSVRVQRALVDYETFEWGPYRLFIQPTPGHSLGHIALVGDVDGRRVAFTGGMVQAPGRVDTLYDLQYTYGSGDGCDYLIYSLGKLRKLGAELACPSQGEPFERVDVVLNELEKRLRAYFSFHFGPLPSTDVAPKAVLPHLLMIPGCSNTWIVVSNSGNALFVDYGCASYGFLSSIQIHFEAGNRLRMLEHNLELLKERFGIRKFDLALPSHYHDDHVNGLPYLQRHHGTRVWCYKNMTDILEHPHGYKLGCTFATPLKVERSLDQGETFKWEEYEFQVFHAPGHADYHMAMFGDIDGTRVAFSGDEINPDGKGSYNSNNIWRNHVHANSHEITGRLFLERQPELTCPGHGEAMRIGEEGWKRLHEWCMTEQGHWRALAAGERVEEAVYPDYVFLYPYQPPCAPGHSVAMQVWYENVHEAPSTLEFRLHLPEGWCAEPGAGELTVAPKTKGVFPFELHVPSSQTTVYRRLPITIDVAIDGRRRGQMAEAVVDLRPEREPR